MHISYLPLINYLPLRRSEREGQREVSEEMGTVENKERGRGRHRGEKDEEKWKYSFEFHKVTDRRRKIHFKVCWEITERNETDGEVKQDMWRLTAEGEQNEWPQQEGWSGGEEERSLAWCHCVLRLGSWSMSPLWLMTAQFSTRYTADSWNRSKITTLNTSAP